MFIALRIVIYRISVVPVSQVARHFGVVYDEELRTTAVGWPPVV
jgi:hypothetical protein